VSLDCLNCHESLAEPVTFDEVFVAVECPICGVRGPIRPLFSPGRFDQAAKLAADDWIYLFNLESNETNGTGKAVSPSAKKPVLDKPELSSQAIAPPPAGVGGEGDLKPNTKGPAAASCVEGQARHEKPGESVSTEAPGALNQVSTRLKAWFKANKTNPDYAVKRDGYDFGVSTATLYKLLKGEGGQATLDKVTAALDRLEGGGFAKVASDTLIEKLPNNFKEPTGLNRCPSPTEPIRCARTP
jgi:hypothetical protein